MNEHPHGITRYRNGCRCPICSRAALHSTTRWKLAVLRNGGEYLTVDVAPARDHVAKLRAAGMTIRTITEQANVKRDLVEHLLYGTTRRIRREHAAALLNVPPNPHLNRDRIPATASRRRLQALALLGWTNNALAPELSAAPATIWKLQAGHRSGITPAFAEKIRAAYTRLWRIDPVTAGAVTAESAARVRNRAKRNGWVPLAAWDDLNDPDALPDLGEETPTAWQRIGEDAHYLIDRHGEEPADAAERLGVSAKYLHKCLVTYRTRQTGKEPAA